MPIRLHRGAPASPADVDQLARHLGEPVHAQFARFVSKVDGAVPDANLCKVNGKDRCSIERFIPVREVWSRRAGLAGLGPRAYPIAEADGGANFVILDQAVNGAILLWDHEIVERPDDLVLLAASLQALLNMLEPFDPKTFQHPGTVVSAWIDPEFLNAAHDAERAKKRRT